MRFRESRRYFNKKLLIVLKVQYYPSEVFYIFTADGLIKYLERIDSNMPMLTHQLDLPHVALSIQYIKCILCTI